MEFYFLPTLTILQFIFSLEVTGQGLIEGLLSVGKNKRNGNGEESVENGEQGVSSRRIGGGGRPSGLNLIPFLPSINLNFNVGGGRRKGNWGGGGTPKPPPFEKLGLVWDWETTADRVNYSGINFADNQGSKFRFFGQDQENKPFGKCQTPSNERGQCRHVEYCVQDVFKYDFSLFLAYSCSINNFYIGVCCPIPKDLPDTDTATKRPNRPRQRPHRRPTKKPKPTPPTPSPLPPEFESNPTCGLSQKQVSRVVGGRKADPKAWPWMAAILHSGSTSSDARAGQYCGGALISDLYVLTASHCVDGFSPNEIQIRLGEYNFNTSNNQRKDFNVSKIITHENYNRYTYKNDIALLQLANSALYTPVCLPEAHQDQDQLANEVGIVTGWGTIYYGGPHSETLMEVLVPIWKQEDCKSAYSQPIEETNLCAGVRAGGRDSCQGDSGGPLQVDVNGRWSAVGLVSWGIRCAEPTYPGIYTRVSKYRDWINQKMAET